MDCLSRKQNVIGGLIRVIPREGVQMMETIVGHYGDFLSTSGVDSGHGIDHALMVMEHCALALQSRAEDQGSLRTHVPFLSDFQKFSILLAALLHDADDGKFFPHSRDYENARQILRQVIPTVQTACTDPYRSSELIIEMIDLVSCSKNRNRTVTDQWKLIPRDADRLTALGKLGIYRCYVYSRGKKNPLFTPHTQRAQNEQELFQNIAPPHRFEQYQGRSDSMMDHFYDKLLHIHQMSSGFPYFLQKAQDLHREMIDFCLEFGRTGTVNEAEIESYEPLSRLWNTYIRSKLLLVSIKLQNIVSGPSWKLMVKS